MARSLRILFSLLLAALPVSAAAQIAVAPDNGTHLDPKIRVANSTGNTVVFTITNFDVDASFGRTCLGVGNVTSVSCTGLGLIAGGGGTKNVTATFATSGAGTGSVQINVTFQGQTTILGAGKWDETIVNPAAAVTPDGTVIVPTPNAAGLTQVFAITNTARAAGTYAVSASCSATGVSGCTVSPAALVLDSAGVAAATGTGTVTYTAGVPGGIGTVALQAKYQTTLLDTGYVAVKVPNATVFPHGGIQNDGTNLTDFTTFTVTNTGPAPATFA